MSGLSAEERYRLLAAAVDRMPDTCDEECSSHGHSRACGEREAALPAAEIVRLSARVDALQLLIEGNRVERDALAARVRELEAALREVDVTDVETRYALGSYATECIRAALAPTRRDTP